MKFKNYIKKKIWKKNHFLDRFNFELETPEEFRRVLKSTSIPTIDDPMLADYESLADANRRRQIDAEVLGSACCYIAKGTFLEIGTSTGRGTALMASNAPSATIYTVNMLPESAQYGEAGNYITHAPDKDQIGAYYREKGCSNVHQIFANTAQWKPEITSLDLAFIDGCHDQEFVINDSILALDRLRPGGLLILHDYNPSVRQHFPWIDAVCCGVEQLYREGWLKDNIFHVRNSWMGVYRKPLR